MTQAAACLAALALGVTAALAAVAPSAVGSGSGGAVAVHAGTSPDGALQPISTVVIAVDDFEDPAWPEGWPWSIPEDPEDPRTYLYQWAPRTCRATSGTHGLWAVGGGTLGRDLACGDSYPASARSAAVLELDLRAHGDARLLALVFDLWADTISDAALGDFVTINYLLPTGQNSFDRVPVFDWTGATGRSFRVQRFDLLDLADLYNPHRRFNLAGTRSDLEFVFRTARDSVFRPEGVFIDNVRLERDGQPTAGPTATATEASPTSPITHAPPTSTASPSPTAVASPTEGAAGTRAYLAVVKRRD